MAGLTKPISAYATKVNGRDALMIPMWEVKRIGGGTHSTSIGVVLDVVMAAGAPSWAMWGEHYLENDGLWIVAPER
jgi:hypothetical protein